MTNITTIAATVLSVLASVASALYAIESYLSSGNDPNEPPVQYPSFPLLGHAFGFGKFGTTYYSKLKAKPSHLMYTLRILPLKIYVVNSTTLFSAVQRAAKTLSFYPFERLTVERFSEASKEILDICDEGGEFENGGDGIFVKHLNEVIRKSLLPGPDLDQMNLETANEIVESLDVLLTDGAKMKELDLYGWIRETMTIAGGKGVYGPMHVYRSKEVRDAFWQFERGSSGVIIGLRRFLPGMKTVMNTMETHFESYFSTKGHEQGSALVRARTGAFQSYGFDARTCAILEWPLSIAILSNTIPSSFWTIFEIFSRPDLLDEVRASLAATVITTTVPATANGHGTTTSQASRHHTLDLSAIKAHSKILLSTFQEMQRTRGSSASVRKVMADTTLENKYLLKKGNYVQLPVSPVHNSTSVWGNDAHTYNPHRFHITEKIKSTSLLSWGFAPHMCPARQFATAEILVLVALAVLRFDIVPLGAGGRSGGDGSGKAWPDLGVNSASIATVSPPKKNLKVRFQPRKEWEGKWSVDVGASMSRFALVSG